MSSTIKKVNKISQIVRLKHVVRQWKTKSLNRQSTPSGSTQLTPPGSLAVYVGPERRRFVIPTRFLNLSVFLALLNQAEEEFGYQITGGLVFPCDVGFFASVLKLLEIDERIFGGKRLDELLKIVAEMGLDCFDQSCKETAALRHGFAPALKKAAVFI